MNAAEFTDGAEASQLVVTDGDVPSLRRVLLNGLDSMLNPLTPSPRPQWICVAVPGDGDPCGGLIGLVTGAWFSIDLLWLPTDLRGRGLGSAILEEAERRAIICGCRGVTVGTTSAAARLFYERYGFVARLELPDVRPGFTQVTLQKTF